MVETLESGLQAGGSERGTAREQSLLLQGHRWGIEGGRWMIVPTTNAIQALID